MRLPETWAEIPLSRVAEDIQPGFAQAPGDEEAGTVPQIRTHNVSPEGQLTLEGIKHVTPSPVELEKYSLAPGDIVFNNTNSEEWVGKTAVFRKSGQYVFSNHMTRIRVRAEIADPDYIAWHLHFLWAIGYSRNRAKRWVSQAAIDGPTLAKTKLVLPTLLEQQQIVTILKQAFALRRRRSEVLSLAKLVPAALFRQMFGDTRRPKHEWRTVSLEKLVTVRSSLKIPTVDDYGSWPCIGPDSIESGTGHVLSVSTVEDIQPQSGKYLFEAGDVLYSKIRPSLAKVALAEDNGFCSADMYALVPGPDVKPRFLQYLLLSDGFTQFALSHSGRAQMPKLNREQLLSFRAIVPPINLQIKFDERVGRLKSIINEIKSSQDNLERLLFLMGVEAFSGQLSQSWRACHNEDLEKADAEHRAALGVSGRRVSLTVTEHAPAERSVDFDRPARTWLREQLSEFQHNVWLAMREWKGSVAPDDTEGFADFCSNPGTAWPIEHEEASPDRIKRTLEQLAALGLIAKVQIPNANGKYMTAFRPLREGEDTRLVDASRLETLLRQETEQS